MNKPVETVLFGGKIVRKDDLRVEAYGTIDELDTFIGLAIQKTKNEEINKILTGLQTDMYIIGSDLASVGDQRKNPAVKTLAQDRLDWITAANENVVNSLPPLHKFILQGGSEPAALMQICRAVCRRAERRIIELSKNEEVNLIIMNYMNILSKLFFNLARMENKMAGINETELR